MIRGSVTESEKVVHERKSRMTFPLNESTGEYCFLRVLVYTLKSCSSIASISRIPELEIRLNCVLVGHSVLAW